MGSRTHEPALVLLHSPLIGPTSWLAVADALERRGRVVVVPLLRSVAGARAPQREIADTVQLATSHLQGPIILVEHSGAGLLLSVIADALTAEVAALILVDSFLPPAAGPVELAPTAFMDQLRSIATDGVLPPWSRWFADDVMRELVHDEDLRAAFESEMPRLPLSYFESAVPLPEDWLRPHAPIHCSAPTPTGTAPPRPRLSAGRCTRSAMPTTSRSRPTRSRSPRPCSS